MASIVETIIGDRRLLIGAESFARQMVWGSNWNKLRIMARCSANDSGGNITNYGLAVGVSVGATQGFDSSSLVEFIGAAPGGSPFGTRTINRGTWNGVLSYIITATQCLYKAGASLTLGSTNGASAGYFPMTSTGNIGGFYCDIARGAGTWTFNTGAYDTAYAASCTMDTFNLACDMDSAGPPGWGWHGNTSIAYSGTGLFDSLMIRYNQASPTLEISNLRVVRFY